MESQVKELKLRLPKHPTKKFNVMRLNVQSKIDLTQLKDPKLVRKESERAALAQKASGKDDQPEFGEGSEYGREQRKEARWRRRGYVPREISIDDHPFLLQESGRKGKSFIGRKEGGVNKSSAYYVLMKSPEGFFEAHPINAWYNFNSSIPYKTLNVEEAEERFSKRDKTMNHFAIMTQKRLKDKEEEGAEEETSKGITERVKGLQVNDEWMDSSGEENDDDDESGGKKKGGKAKKKTRRRRKQEDAGSDVEDPDLLQSNELDYISSESSEEEEDKMIDQLKKKKGDEKAKTKSDDEAAADDDDDEENRPEDEPEKRSDDEEEADEEANDDDDDDEGETGLTKSGKETRKLLRLREDGDGADVAAAAASGTGGKESDDELDVDDNFDADEDESVAQSSILNKSKKRLREEEVESTSSSSSKKPKIPNKVVVETPPPPPPLPPPSAKKSTNEKTNRITADAVKRYLSLKPMTTKDLLKKFKRKTDLNGEKIVLQLGEILRKINPHQEKIQGKVYLSLKKSK